VSPVIPKKKLRSANQSSRSQTTSEHRQNNDWDTDWQPGSEKGTSKSTAKSSTGERHEVIDVDAPDPAQARRSVTQPQPAPKARVSFASARTSSPKPFVTLDPDSIRRGLQEGGENSKKRDISGV